MTTASPRFTVSAETELCHENHPLFVALMNGTLTFPLSPELQQTMHAVGGGGDAAASAPPRPATVRLRWLSDGASITECNIAHIAAFVGDTATLEALATLDDKWREALFKGRASGSRSVTEFAARRGDGGLGAASARVLHRHGLLEPTHCNDASSLDSRYIAAACGNIEYIKLLQEIGVPLEYVHPSGDGETLLHVSARKSGKSGPWTEPSDEQQRCLRVLEFLLDNRIYKNPEAKMKDTSGDAWITPFAVAARYGNVAALTALHKAGASQLCLREGEKRKFALERVDTATTNINDVDRDEYRLYSRWTNFPVVDHDQCVAMTEKNGPPLVTYKITIDRRRSYLNSPLHRAASGAHCAAIKYLLEIGFTAEHATCKGVASPVYYAATSTVEEPLALAAVKLLCEAKCDVNAVDDPSRNLTPLYGACWLDRPLIARYLLAERGASSSVQYCGRSTPFVGCIANKSKRCLQVLLDLRADTSTPRGTQTPLEYARSLKCDEITAMLIDAGI